MSHFARTSLAPIVVAASCFLAGCASSTLQLDLAMYHGDPSYGVSDSETLSRDIAHASTTLARTQSLVTQAKDRAEEANTLFEVYSSVFRAKAEAGNNPDSDDNLRALRGRKEKYVASLAPLARELPGEIAALQAAIATVRTAAAQLHLDPTNAKNAAKLQQARADMHAAVVSLRTLLADFDLSAGADYIGWIRLQGPKYAAWLKANLRTAQLDDSRDGPKPNSLAAHPGVQSAITSALISLRPFFVNQPQLLRDFAEADSLQKALPLLERALPSATESVAAKSTEIAREVQGLASGSLFHDMLEFDNLQNAADPRWRVVKDPRNDRNWVELKQQTYFYSEGKNSVVVVRDRPDDFRVQNASNNPTALIRSQLEISRAVTDAAIAIGGAAAGVPKLTAFVATATAPGSVTDDSMMGEQQAAAAARIAEETRLRNAVLADLKLRLRQAQSDLEAAGSDATKIRAAADEFYALVQAAKALLPTSAPANPPTGGTNQP